MCMLHEEKAEGSDASVHSRVVFLVADGLSPITGSPCF